MTSSTDGYSHLVMTTKAVQLTLDFPGFGVQFNSTRVTVEMIGMIRFSLKLERSSFINDCMTLEADVLSNCSCFFSGITFMAKSSACIFDESHVSQRHLTTFTPEAKRMPVVVQGFDDSSNNEFSTFCTTGSIKNLEVVFAVLSSFKLVKDGILSKGLEALGTNEAALMPYFTSCDRERGSRIALQSVYD